MITDSSKTMWIARDLDNTLWMYLDKPVKKQSRFDACSGRAYTMPKILFEDVTFDNSPRLIDLRLIESYDVFK
jgi:hypothetical protein